jgi:uncharacterized protein YigE (DUF2233 family)
LFYWYKNAKMAFKNYKFLLFFILLGVAFWSLQKPTIAAKSTPNFLIFELNPQNQVLKLYWKDDKNQLFSNIGNLKNWLDAKGEKLIFATNAGMFKPDHSSVGLFIDAGKTIVKLDTGTAPGNFYLKPNGVFYTTKDNKAFVCTTEAFKNDTNIQYATQSGPMLLVNGTMLPIFKKGSINVNIRNGVGILPNNNAVFVTSKNEVNFYDFANYFKQLGCKDALYLDGFVSKAYLPEQGWSQLEGKLGVLIGVTDRE